MRIASKSYVEDGYNKPFARRLRKLLRERRVTQEELANSVGVKRQSVASWKDGKTVPDAGNLLGISRYFNVSCDYLLGVSEVPTPNLDLQSIHKKTGLSEESIKILVDCYGRDKANSITLTVNALLENRFALGAISRYLYYDLDEKAHAGNVVLYKDKYRYIKKASNPLGFMWSGADTDVKPPIDFSHSVGGIDNDTYKQVLMLKVQHQLRKLLESESLIERFAD